MAIIQFFKESYEEMTQKVTWPTWRNLQSSAVLVLIASLIIALIIAGMDKASTLILNTIYESFS